MWDLFKSFFAFGLATSLEKLIAFLLLPLYTSTFSVTEYGYIDLIQVTIIIITTFSVLQFETSLQRYYYEYKGHLKVVFISTIFNTIIICSIITAALAILTYSFYSKLLFKNYNADIPYFFACIQIPFSNIIMLLLLVIRFEKKSTLFALAIILKVLLTLCFTYLFIKIFPLGLNGVFGAQLLSNILISVLLLYKNKSTIKFTFNYRLYIKAWKYAYPQIPARFGSVLSGNINRYLMVGYLSVTAIGIYSLALKLASVMQLFYTAFILAWTPFIFRQIKINNHHSTFAKALLLIACPVFLLVNIMSLFSTEILQIVSKSTEYKNAAYLIGGLSLYFSMFIFKEIVDIGPRFKEKTIYISINYFLSFIVNIIMLFLLINKLGERGVVLSMIFTNIILLISSWYFSNKLYHIPYNVISFIILFIPALIIAILTMYHIYSIEVRIIALLTLLCFYIILFIYHLKKNKNTV